MIRNLNLKSLEQKLLLLAVVFSSFVGVKAQVYTRPASAAPTATPLIERTTDVRPRTVQPARTGLQTIPTANSSAAVPPVVSSVPTSNADISRTLNVDTSTLEPAIGGNRGILVETENGRLITQNFADVPLNPASNIKLATALASLKMFGAKYRFPTNVSITGTVDLATGTLDGDLIIDGRDPSFNSEHAIAIAHALNERGIRIVRGDLIVSPGFAMEFNSSASASASRLRTTMDANRRSAAATRAWQTYLINSNRPNLLAVAPNVTILGQTSFEAPPSLTTKLFTHESVPLKDILKVLLSYSNNFMAEKVGDAVGGSEAVEQICINETKSLPQEIQLASSSGLGMNRVTPRAMMRIYRSLVAVLTKNGLTVGDILPVAGVDPGTLQNRFNFGNARGSVIAKTGTLPSTDGGVSTLVGQMKTQKGEVLYFVIFNHRGNVNRFRTYQNQYVAYMQNIFGGAASFVYQPTPFAQLLAQTNLK